MTSNVEHTERVNMASSEAERDVALQLSCESSDFDSDLEMNVFQTQSQSCGAPQPYQFEPQISSSDDDGSEGERQAHDQVPSGPKSSELDALVNFTLCDYLPFCDTVCLHYQRF